MQIRHHVTMNDSKRVALVANASFYVGPAIARELAEHGHDVVIGDPVEGLVDELTDMGARVEAVTGVGDLSDPGSSRALVEAALKRFGRVASAVAPTGAIVIGRFLKSSVEDLRKVFRGCLEAPYQFLRAVVPVMAERGDGQVLIITSASGGRPTPGAPLYSSARAGANMLVRNVAAEVAHTGVQVNAVGSNFMDFPEFLKANRASDPEGRARVEAQVPMGRLGGLEELAHFCMPFLDGKSRFTTGQFMAYAGGWA